MGRKSRDNLKRKNAQVQRQEHQRATEKNLRLTLMNMRQLYNTETQKALGLSAALDEARTTIAAFVLQEGDGEKDLAQEFLDRAQLMDGIQVQPLDDGAGYSFSVIEAPPEDDDEEPVSSEE